MDDYKKLLTDAQKAIIIKFLLSNPKIFGDADPFDDFPGDTCAETEEMVGELNGNYGMKMNIDFWFDGIEVWKDTVRKDYFHAKRTRNVVSSFHDLQLMTIIRNEMEAKGEPVTPAKVKKITCRLCMKDVSQEDSFNLFTSFVEKFTLCELLNACINVIPVTEDDGLPDAICFHCSKVLRIVHSFKLLCENNDKLLRINRPTKKVMQKHEPESDPEEYDVVVEELEDDESSIDHLEDVSYQDLDEPVPVHHVKTELNDSLDSSEESSSEESVAPDTIEQMEQPKEKKKRKPRKKREPTEPKVKRAKKERGPRQCPDCGKVFPNNSRLQIHRVSVHETDKSHSCEICGKAFNTAPKLAAHLVSHTEERPFVCTTCGKGFKIKPSLRTHELVHKKEKNYHCEHCNFAGSTKMSLVIHLRTHTGERPFPCQFCELAFTTYSNRAKHTRNVHQRVKEHKCIHCGKEFFNRLYALKHTITHSGARPFYCTFEGCTAAYGWYANLKHHVSKRHPGADTPKENEYLKDLEAYVK